ncbi:hypothetical protein GCM10027269_36460 [Kribbella endophytica]
MRTPTPATDQPPRAGHMTDPPRSEPPPTGGLISGGRRPAQLVNYAETTFGSAADVDLILPCLNEAAAERLVDDIAPETTGAIHATVGHLPTRRTPGS